MHSSVCMAFFAIHAFLGKLFPWSDTKNKSKLTKNGRKFEKQRVAIIIQTAWRRYKSKKAAVILQRWWRQKLKKIRKMAMENAANIIQNAWRQYKLKKIAKIAMESAAVVIQNAWRQYKLKKMAKIAMESAAVVIQNGWRQYKLQKIAKIAMESAAVVIQNGWRQYKLQKIAKIAMESAAVVIQNGWRQYKLQKIAKIAMESAAVVIQNGWRQYKLQKIAKIAMESAAVVIQNGWRQYKLQKIAKIASESAAIIIQNAWWQYKVQKVAKVAMESAAVVIQNAWRQYKLQKIAKIASENAAIIIQNAWRQYKLQKIAKIAIEKAARCIQNAWKLFKLRKQRRVEMSKIELKRKADVSPQELGHPPAKLQRLENITWVSSMNNFQYIRHLGTGGFANVLLFHNQNTTQEFAFKVQDRTNRTIFLNEVKALRAAQASNFVTKLCGSFSIRNLLFLVFQFLPGGDLENHILRYGRLAINAARFYACEIICAVQYLHHRGIIHRDLKLDNVLIDREGHIRVGDFGLSTFMKTEESRNACCGTIYYLAPEMLLRNFYDTSVDWWAIGVIIYRLLTAEFPFFSEDEDEVAVTKAILYSPLYIPDFISSEAEDCLTQFLERTPQLRLGYEKGNFPSLKDNPFFYAIAWEDVANGELEPPFVPCQSEAWNTSCNSSSSLSEQSPSISRRRRTSYFPSID